MVLSTIHTNSDERLLQANKGLERLKNVTLLMEQMTTGPLPRSNKDGSIHLHARKIGFTHPVSKEQIFITAPTPKDVLWNACF